MDALFKTHISKKLAMALCFIAAVVIVKNIALQLGTVANATTVGFAFLVIVVLSAVFAGLVVAIVTSLIAALFFNYFFFPPVGTFIIADPANWVALFVFLFTAIVISRLTASAHESARHAEVGRVTLGRLDDFGAWLLSIAPDLLTLSAIAEGAVRIFSLEYCSLHVFAQGKWHHFTGTATGELSQKVVDTLKTASDHPTRIIEIVEELGLGVRYCQIRTGSESLALLAVKSDSLPTQAINTIGWMIGMRLREKL